MSDVPQGEDRTLFGEGRYPDDGPLAVLARLGLIGSAMAIVVAVLLPREVLPQFVRSHNLEHFAAFYVAALFGLAALPRTLLRRIAAGYVAFATILESIHLFTDTPLGTVVDNWVADLGGLAAALAPVVIDRFRRRFARRAS